MIVSQNFDPTLDSDAEVVNRDALVEVYTQKLLGRLFVLNCKHKLVKNSI